MHKEHLLASEWTNLGRWMQPPLSGCFWTHWHESESARGMLPAIELSQILFLDGYVLLLARDSDAIHTSIADAYAHGTISELCERYERIAQKAEREHLAIMGADVPDAEYAAELFRTYREMVGLWMYGILLADAAEKMARAIYSGMTDEELLRRIRPYVRQTWLERQVQEVGRLAALAREIHVDIAAVTLDASNRKLEEEITRHLQEFAWFGTHHWEGEGYTRNTLLADMREAKPHLAEHVDAPSAEKQDEDLWRLVAACFYWRTHAAETTAKVIFASRGRLSAIARSSWGLEYAQFIYLSADEILVGLRGGGTAALPHNFAERKQGYGCYIPDTVEHIITGHELKEAIARTVKIERTEGVTEFKGTIASKSKPVQGRVKVVLAPSDFAKFERGDILVVPETTPDFVPLMKIAAAIVTEVGGITSHAAIVSRELKKPCIIGTKIATQVLKDGDLVEVDAEKGIVHILSSNLA